MPKLATYCCFHATGRCLHFLLRVTSYKICLPITCSPISHIYPPGRVKRLTRRHLTPCWATAGRLPPGCATLLRSPLCTETWQPGTFWWLKMQYARYLPTLIPRPSTPSDLAWSLAVLPPFLHTASNQNWRCRRPGKGYLFGLTHTERETASLKEEVIPCEASAM